MGDCHLGKAQSDLCEALKAEIEATKRERDDMHDQLDVLKGFRSRFFQQERWREEAENETAEVRAALKRYGRHDGVCLAGFDGEVGRRHPCSCGLAAALGDT